MPHFEGDIRLLDLGQPTLKKTNITYSSIVLGNIKSLYRDTVVTMDIEGSKNSKIEIVDDYLLKYFLLIFKGDKRL